jgi:predicted methyltransferase
MFVGEFAVLHRTGDPHDGGVFAPAVRGKTDRLVLKFGRP